MAEKYDTVTIITVTRIIIYYYYDIIIMTLSNHDVKTFFYAFKSMSCLLALRILQNAIIQRQLTIAGHRAGLSRTHHNHRFSAEKVAIGVCQGACCSVVIREPHKRLSFHPARLHQSDVKPAHIHTHKSPNHHMS